MKRLFALAIAVAALAAIAAPANAQQVCAQLESQLAALQRQNPQATYQSLLQQYQQAQQNYERLYSQADQAGCIPRLFRPEVPASCNGIRSQLDQQYAQVMQLQEQLRANDPSQANAAVNSVLQALGNNNCGPQYAAYANQNNNLQIGNGALLDRIFGDRGQVIIPDQNAPVPTVTTYRTICVRECDGYYFPISFATTQRYFEEDQRTCQAQCPGATLYTHRNPGGTVEEAVSVNGQPYTAMENAFAYRTAFNPACGCRPATTIAEEPQVAATPVSGEMQTVIASVAASYVLLPRPRPEPSEDPDTLANRAGNYTPGAFNLGMPTRAASTLVNAEGTRLIGPAYLYAQ